MPMARRTVLLIAAGEARFHALSAFHVLRDTFTVVFPDLKTARNGLPGVAPDLVIVSEPGPDGSTLLTLSASLTDAGSGHVRFGLPGDEESFKSALKTLLSPPGSERNDLYGDLFDRSHIGMAMVGGDLHFMRVNDAYAHMTGYSKEELTRMTFSDITHPEDREKDVQAGRRLYSGESSYYRTEKRYVRKDGEVIWIHLNSWIVPGTPLHSIAIIEDITARVELERRQLRLRTAVEQAGEGIIITDASGAITFCNPAFERITGYPKEEVLGRNPRFLQSGKHDEAFYRRMWDTLLSGSVWEGRISNRRKDGTLFEEESTISPLVEAGKIAGFVAVIRDVTERIGLENRLRQANRLDSIGRLAGGVAHDFNNLLTVINGYAEYALRSLPGEHPLHHALTQIRKAGGRAAELTSQLLAFSRKQVVAPKPVQLNDVVTDSLAMFRRLVGEDIEILPRLSPEATLVSVDPGNIHQVLMNLVVNARDAMPDGGSITIETERIAMPAGRPDIPAGDYMTLCVADTGVGMTDDVRQRVFDPFYTTREAGKGTGLGLSTVYGIIQQAGGWVQVESQPGMGATFRVGLPVLLSAAISMPLPAEHTARPADGTETILVVEDQPEVRALVVSMLRDCRYHILEAGSGLEALRVASQFHGPIQLVLTDVIMPYMTGKQLVEQLLPRHPAMRSLYMSGYTSDVIAQRGVLDSGIDFIAKPFTQEALARKVRSVLGAESR